jgi:hypothetical protein
MALSKERLLHGALPGCSDMAIQVMPVDMLSRTIMQIKQAIR